MLNSIKGDNQKIVNKLFLFYVLKQLDNFQLVELREIEKYEFSIVFYTRHMCLML